MYFEKNLENRITVTDLSDPALKVYSKHSENQLKHLYEPDPGVFIAESPQVIMRALDAGYVPESMLVETEQLHSEAKAVLEKASLFGEFQIYTADAEVLKDITGYYLVRGLLAVMRRKKEASVEALCQNAKKIVVLEDIVNPTNIGAIIRSAAALGMDGILLTDACADPLYRRAARVSMGTVFQIPWTYYKKKTETDHYIQKLHKLGFKAASMALSEHSIPVTADVLKETEKLAIILGTEGDGLKKETIEQSDFTVKIPMYHQVDSLNVAAASAVAFWELQK